jgi:hypothetical protein
MPFPARFVRSVDYYYSALRLPSAATDGSSLRLRKIFVIKESIWPLPFRGGEGRPTTDPSGKAIQRILICDDHPDSLRLLLGRRARPQNDPAQPASSGWWEPFLGAMLITGALVLIYLPLFWKLSS